MPFDTTLDPTTDVILGAIDYLETHGWHKGGRANGPARCVLGALREAAGARSHALNQAAERVRRANGITIDLPFWNDAQERTKEQVLDALRNSLIALP